MKREHPKGPKRHEDPEWAKMIQSHIYPHHTDIDWEEYVGFVEEKGGDEWFQEEEEEDSGEEVQDVRCVRDSIWVGGDYHFGDRFL